MSSPEREINEEIDLRVINEDVLQREQDKVKKAKKIAKEFKALQRQLTGSRSPISFTERSRRALPAGFETRIPRGEFLFGGGVATGLAPLTKFQQEQKIKNPRVPKFARHNPFIEARKVTREGLSLIQNPTAWIAAKLPQILKIAGPAAIVFFAVEVAQTVFELFKAQFGAGGIFDVRKLVLDQVKEISQLDTILRIRSGQVFFTSDAGQRLRQRAPEVSNTRTLRDGHIRYIQLHLGE